MLTPYNLKKTWLAPEDTVFARVSFLAAAGEGGSLSCTYA